LGLAFNTIQLTQRIWVIYPTSPDPLPGLSDPSLFPPIPPVAEPPTATFTVTPTIYLVGSAIDFDGSDSTGTGTLEGRWDWENDGVFDTIFSTVLTATHVYTVSGDTTARFEVRDQTTLLSAAALRTLKLLPGPLVSLEILPDDAALIPNENLQWRYEALDVYANPIFGLPLTWGLLNPLAGQLSASGVFTASLKYGQYTAVIKLSNNGVSDTASLLIYAPYKVYLPLTRR
jgi:hypothetical protein